MKNGLLVVALVLIAAVVVRLSVPDPPPRPSTPGPPGGPSFVVQVLKPRSARPFAGLLPDGLLGLPPNALAFDHASPGAEVRHVAPDRLELGAEGWEFTLALEPDGRVAADTQVVFSLELANRQRTLRARPADDAAGRLDVLPRPGTNLFDGSFHVELGICEDAETGRTLDWPGAPFTVRGVFEGLTGSR